MRVGQLSHRGSVRPNNEDSIYSSRNKDLFIIADGMGGHTAGEIASKTAIKKVRYFIRTRAENYEKTRDGYLSLISDAIRYANRLIFSASNKDESLRGMGTTLIAALADDNKVYLGHVGDSRAYIINSNSISQITTDHSLAEELYRSGSITKEEALNHPQKNIITRALGCSSSVKPDLYTVELWEGEILLLCTDGLSNMVGSEDIFKIIKETQNINDCAKKLVDAAIQAGGSDNISVIVIKSDK